MTTINYTCRKCNREQTMEAVNDDLRLVWPGLKVNVCSDCDGRLPELSKQDKVLADWVGGLGQEAFAEKQQHWKQMRAAHRRSTTGYLSISQLRAMSRYDQLIARATRSQLTGAQPAGRREWMA